MASVPRGPNQWGYDRSNPNLEPPRGLPDNRPHFIQRAIKHWGRETFDQRKSCHPELLRRRRGRASKRRGIEVRLEVRSHKRGDRTAVHHRFARVLAIHASASTMLVGLPDASGEIRPFRLERLAELVGCSSPWQLDRVISDFVAAGLIFRHQGRERDEERGAWRGRVAILRVTELFWIKSGGVEVNEQRKAWARRQARRAEPPPPDATEPVVRQFIRDLARERRLAAEEADRNAGGALEELRRRQRPPPT